MVNAFRHTMSYLYELKSKDKNVTFKTGNFSKHKILANLAKPFQINILWC